MKYSADTLRLKRSIKEAELFCEQVFSSISKDEFKKFRLKRRNGNDSFNRDFWEEYYPLFLYSNRKKFNEDYIISLLGFGEAVDAKIFDKNDRCMQSIQMTTASFNKESADKLERFLDRGISGSREMRSVENVLEKDGNQILYEITKKLKHKNYKNIDVLLVVTDSILNRARKSYYEGITNFLADKFDELKIYKQKIFKEIYLIDYSCGLVKLM